MFTDPYPGRCLGLYCSGRFAAQDIACAIFDFTRRDRQGSCRVRVLGFVLHSEALPIKLGPTDVSRRIVALDVLRGVAVLGILPVNLPFFAMPEAWAIDPVGMGGAGGADLWVWTVTYVLARFKFITIFALLLGAGVLLTSARAESAGRNVAALHYRRMGALAVIGLLHAHVLWYGDILFPYALCAMAVYPLRKVSPKVKLIIAAVCLLLVSGGTIVCGIGWSLGSVYYPPLTPKVMTHWAEQAAVQLQAYRGSWLDQAPHRSMQALMYQTAMMVFLVIWWCGGMMLIGMVLLERGVLTAARSRRFYAVMTAGGFAIGLPICAAGVWFYVRGHLDLMMMKFFGSQPNFWASMLVAAGWIGLVMLACKAATMRRVNDVLAAAGRMALTNYLMQSVICTTLFYGHGLGWFGYVGHATLPAVAAVVWAVQLAYSWLWLRWFRFGPAEWAWRTVTYMKWQPMRRKAAEASRDA